MLIQKWQGNVRTKALLRFAAALTTLNILGYSFLGFEPAWITPFIAALVAFSFQCSIETLQALVGGTKPAFLEKRNVDLLIHFIPTYISSIAVSMLLYSNGSLYEIIFAMLVAIGSKYIFVAPMINKETNAVRYGHFLNPSNFGICAVIILFPWVGISPPYQFTENITGVWDTLLIVSLFFAGSLLNIKLTKRYFLVLCWFAAFATQSLLRAYIHDFPVLSGLMPMTGLAFILFSLYMVTDPPTTPSTKPGQALFAVSIAAIYGLLMELHIVFGLFFALTITTACRGIYLWWEFYRLSREGYVATAELTS